MDKLLKPGIIAEKKIKSNIKKWILVAPICIGLVTSLACTRTVRYPNSTIDPVITFLVPTLAQTETAVAIASEIAATQSPIQPTPEIVQTTAVPTPGTPIMYYTQSGDTLTTLAVRFNVNVEEIQSNNPLPPTRLLSPDLLLIIPDRLSSTAKSEKVVPDSEVVYSSSALDFNTEKFIMDAGGYLSTYTEWRTFGNQTGVQIVERVAIENSVNPRILLSLLEYQSHWVFGQPQSARETDYPMGKIDFAKKGLYYQLSWAVSQLSVGYYGWRAGLLTDLEFTDGATARLAPGLNAGSVAIQHLFSKLINSNGWENDIYGPDGWLNLHQQMFESPWLRAQLVEPLYPPSLKQPNLVLPFYPGVLWVLTGGPHSAWGTDGALAALDFAPASESHGCVDSPEWVTASAPGLVTRSGNGVVMVDLDGDGHEQTGWNILYMHITTVDRVPAGTWLNTNDRIGHPSCEGGASTGTHMHIARKYNGEWILADGPMPFNLDGWIAHNGEKPYKGWLSRGDEVVRASSVGEHFSRIIRSGDDT